MNRCAFLDRDGTIIVDRGYLSDPSQVELLPRAAEGLRLLQKSGYLLVVISNQSGVGRGFFTLEDLEKVDLRMRALLAEEGVRLDGVYYCEHREDEGCPCRKPGTALARKAARELGIDLGSSVVIGDKTSDLMMGKSLGCATILVETGMGGGDENFRVEPDWRAKNLLEAAGIIAR
jgi:histidinol-phosphate phosphatase family protein